MGARRAMATPSLRGRLARLGNPRRPVLKPNKPLILANRVGERRREKGEATCITEMSVMMACWKQNEFRDEACRKEIQEFFNCASKAEATRKMRPIQETLGEFRSLPPNKLNKLIQRFPNKPYVS
ncbi:small ribosomal subunit protein mS37 [Tamandua tetradactyla]|uniref:small ribosomal subunit protein mS37 n=1 Tax=Tamandua tetradactyla TaxID=48850 RepID=UPI0040537BBC